MEFSDLIKDCLEEHLSIRPEVCKTTEGEAYSLRISIYWDDDRLNSADLDLTLPVPAPKMEDRLRAQVTERMIERLVRAGNPISIRRDDETDYHLSEQWLRAVL